MKCELCTQSGINLGREKGTCDHVVTIRHGHKKPTRYVVCSDHVKQFTPSSSVSISDFKGLQDCPRCNGTGSVPINYAQGVCFLCNGTGKSNKLARL